MTSSRPGNGNGAGREPGRERTSYTRFIPREELEGVAVWSPGSLGESFDGAVARAAPHMPWQPLDDSAPAKPDSPLQAAARAAGVKRPPETATATPPAPAGPAPAAAGTPDLVIEPATAHAGGAAGALPEPEAAAAPDAAMLQQAQQAQLAELQAQWEARLEAEVSAARQSGYQDGYRDGLEALDSFKSSYAQQVTAQVGQVLQSLDGELRQLEQGAAASLARVAIALARQVVRSELQTHPALVTQVAQEAVNAVLTGARQVTVKLHPDDHGLVAEGCAEALAARGARLVPEPSMERGGCLVETEAGGVDARIATRWAAVMQTMGSAEPWPTSDAAGDAA